MQRVSGQHRCSVPLQGLRLPSQHREGWLAALRGERAEHSAHTPVFQNPCTTVQSKDLAQPTCQVKVNNPPSSLSDILLLQHRG